jgi:hypothetical protein
MFMDSRQNKGYVGGVNQAGKVHDATGGLTQVRWQKKSSSPLGDFLMRILNKFASIVSPIQETKKYPGSASGGQGPNVKN